MPPGHSSAFERSGSAILVIALHAILIYLIATALGIVKPPQIIAPMEAKLITTPEKTSEAPPPEIKPELTELQLGLVVPETVVELPVAEEAPAAPPEPVADSAPAVMSADLQVRRRIEPGYPPASRRLGEEGTVTVKVLVDERGRAREVSVVRSSGHGRLDQAAVEAIRRWLFAPAVRDSQPVMVWTNVQVTFRLDA